VDGHGRLLPPVHLPGLLHRRDLDDGPHPPGDLPGRGRPRLRSGLVAVILTILIELGLITPPVGLNLYVLQGISGGHSMRDIALGATPFMAAMLGVIALLSYFPGLATWLPSLMLK